MTPTQPSQAVESAVQRLMGTAGRWIAEELMGRNSDDANAACAELEAALRAELARPQEVAAPQTQEADPADIIAGALQTSRAHAYELMEQAVRARRVPVALPAPDLSARLTRASNSILTGRADLSDSNACAIAAEIFTTPAPKQGDAKDARPDSFHSDSGDRNRVQRVELSGDELALFQRTLDDFADCGETETDYEVLVNWARRGLLECTNFRPTAAAHRMLASSTSTDQKGNAA